MASATITSLDYESLTLFLMTCVTLLAFVHLVKALMPAFERMHERTVAAIRPPARQATLQMESGARATPETGKYARRSIRMFADLI